MAERSIFLRRGRLAGKPRPGRAARWLLLVLVAAASGIALARLLGASLTLERFQIEGNRRVRTAEILSALAPWRGENLLTLDLAPLAQTLTRHAWIERITLSKRFPDGLSVLVVERRAVALLRQRERLWWLSKEGRPIAVYDPRADPSEYVLISGDRALPEAVALLEELRVRRPEYYSALSEIAALPGGGFGMMDSIFRRPVRVLRRDASEKIRALLEARSLMETRGWEARAIDLRFADRVVLVGAYGAGNSL